MAVTTGPNGSSATRVQCVAWGAWACVTPPRDVPLVRDRCSEVVVGACRAGTQHRAESSGSESVEALTRSDSALYNTNRWKHTA